MVVPRSINIAVFGATGRTGRQVVAHAVATGHHVRAFVRSPDNAALPDGVEIRSGDVGDRSAVEAIVNGTEAVISCLGSNLLQTFRTDGRVNAFGVPNIVAAMQAHGASRIVAMSSYGAGSSLNRMGRVARLGMSTIMHGVLSDMNALEQALQGSDLNWTIVRPTNLTGQPATGNVVEDPNHRIGIAASISRADVAAFMVRILDNEDYVRRIVLLTGKPL